VSNLQPAPRPIPRSRIWFQIQHHQDKSHATGQHRFLFILAAILTTRNCHDSISMLAATEKSCKLAIKMEID
jgi:hypothetical protein